MKPMPLVHISAATFAVLLLAGTGMRVLSREAKPLRTSSDWKNCGVEKLSDREFQNFLTFSRSRTDNSDLDRAAMQFMLKQGWQRTEVLGYFDSGDTDRPEELIAMGREGRIYLLDPPLAAKRIDPGFYWTKGSSSTWEVLRLDGSVEGIYWVKETWE